jgi:NAD-dependent dihydropyrimidine dehydrogenase PreA subunit
LINEEKTVMAALSYRMLMIDGVPAGLLGLAELFDAIYEADHHPDDENIGEVLIQGLRKHNFIPKPAIAAYNQVIIREFRTYYQKRTGGSDLVAQDYGTWEGYPRENIPWFPTISGELCDGCGKCLEVCPKVVFTIDEIGKAVVVEPFLCIVGCCFCKSACDPGAILMPNREMLDHYRHGQRHST